MNTTIEVAEMRAFGAVVSEGSFTAAGEILGTDKAHVSRIVSRLEKKLGARLLERSTRQLHVTEIGLEFYERTLGILLALEETENAVARASGIPNGVLKLTTGSEFGLAVVNHWVAQYLEEYPGVSVEAEYTNRMVDIIHEGFDVAIRVGPLPDSELSARKLGEIDYHFCASPNYLQHSLDLKHPDDLMEHKLIVFSPRGQANWDIHRGEEKLAIKPIARFAVNNNQAALEMAIAGAGVALLPSILTESAIRNKLLSVVLPEWKLTPSPVHAVFPSSRYMAPKVRAFVDLAVESFVQIY